MLERFSQRGRSKQVIETSDKVLTTLYQQGDLDPEITGSARAVVKITQQPNPKANLKPKDIKNTARALATGLEDHRIQSSTLYPEAIQAMPVLADEYQRRVTSLSPTQHQLGEVRIDNKTTLIQPVSKARQMAVSRRGFLGRSIKIGAVVTSVGVTGYSCSNILGIEAEAVQEADQQIRREYPQVNKPLNERGLTVDQALKEQKAINEIKANKEREIADKKGESNWETAGILSFTVFLPLAIAALLPDFGLFTLIED